MTLWTAGSRSSGCGYGDAMLLRRAAAPIALLAAVALAGCTAPAPDPEPTIAPTEEPLFASEEEALAAAEEVYSAYVVAVETALQAGGETAPRLDGIASEEVTREQTAGADSYRAEGLRALGNSSFVFQATQFVDQDAAEGEPVIGVYVCRDVKDTDVVNETGESIVTEDRQELIPFEVEFSRLGTGLVVDKDELWPGETFC